MLTLLAFLLISPSLADDPEVEEEEDYPVLQLELEDVKIKRRAPIPMPEEAKEIELPRVTCSMRVFFDVKGITESVTVAGCPEEFHQAVHDSVMMWRFKPVKTPDRDPARATFTMAVNLDLTQYQRAEDDEDALE